jgi:hypothetical protein
MDTNVHVRLSLNRSGTVENNASYSVQPETIVNVTLKKHQLQTIQAMTTLECNKNRISDHEYLVSEIGVLSNKVGSGKSLCVLGLVATRPRLLQQDFVTCHISDAMFVMNDRSNTHIHGGNLIVVPHHMIPTWDDYIQKYTTLSNVVIKKKMFPLEWNDISNRDIVLCGAKYYNMLCKSCPWTWSRVVFDEADSINIPACIKPNARLVWFVTSSLKNLLFSNGFYYKCDSNGIVTRVVTRGILRQGYIKNTFKELEDARANNVLRGIVVKMNDDYVDQHVCLPPIHNHIVRCKDPIYLCVLKDVVSEGVESRLHGCDTDGAIEYMGCPADTKDNIVSVVCRSLHIQMKNYELKLQYLNNMKATLDAYSICELNDSVNEKIRKTVIKINEFHYKLSHIHTKVALVANEDMSLQSCPICMDDTIEEMCMYMCCLNVFCKRCVQQMTVVNNKCPMCRSDMKTNDVLVRQITPLIKDSLSKNKYDKVIELVKCIYSSSESRVLIFVWHDNSLTTLAHSLYAQHFQSFRILSGNVNSIKNTVNMFNNGRFRVLLINAYVYGCGLNLIGATDVIFFQKTNNEVEKQLIGRANRIGRTNELNIHRVLHDSE